MFCDLSHYFPHFLSRLAMKAQEASLRLNHVPCRREYGQTPLTSQKPCHQCGTGNIASVAAQCRTHSAVDRLGPFRYELVNSHSSSKFEKLTRRSPNQPLCYEILQKLLLENVYHSYSSCFFSENKIVLSLPELGCSTVNVCILSFDLICQHYKSTKK